MKRTTTNTVGIEDAILSAACQTCAQFDRTRRQRTSAIEGLLGDLGCVFEEKPVPEEIAPESSETAEEILVAAEAIRAIQAMARGQQA
jgi:hypothetical protein